MMDKETQLLLVAVLSSLLVGLALGESQSACFGTSTKTINLDCGTGYLLHISRSFYGFSPTGQCRLVAEEVAQGCTVDDRVHYGCVGQSSCSINLPTGRYGVNVPECGQPSNYFQVEYTCVRASSVQDICQAGGRLTDQTGYITTPGYPSNYRKQGKCETTIAVQAGQKLRLHIIDLELKPLGHTDCADLLYFNDKMHSITLCGTRTNHSYSLHSNFLHLELQSTSGGLSKGFWLYYEAYPPLPTTIVTPDIIDNSGRRVSLNDEDGDNNNNNNNDNSITESGQDGTTPSKTNNSGSTVPLYRDEQESGKKIPFAPIAGGVIGTLSLILLVLLLLLFIKWCKERKYQKAEKILEIRNPAFRSSNDFHDTQQARDAGYYC